MTGGTSSELHFVVVERPADARSATVRRQVRSHVTKAQHRRAREAKGDKPTLRFVDGKDGRSAKQKQDTGVKKARAPTSAKTRDSTLPRSTASTRQDDDEVEEVQRQMEQATARRQFLDVLHESGAGGLFAKGAMYLRTIALDDADNGVGIMLSRLNCNVTTVWSFHENTIHTRVRVFEATTAGVERGVHAACLLSFLWQDPVLLSVAMLSATRALLASRGRAVDARENYHLLHLRGNLIQRVNLAMTDPVRRISDHMICAVLFFALLELRYTSVHAYRAHMAGLVSMINMRGGLGELRRSVSHIAHLIVWQDKFCASLVGGEPYCNKMLDDATPSYGQGPPRITEVS